MEFSHKLRMDKLEECPVDRYDILMALMKSSQTQDMIIQAELSKLLKNITLQERETRQYIKTVNVRVSGNENLLAYIRQVG